MNPTHTPELERCPFCGIFTETPCDGPPPGPICSTLSEHMLRERPGLEFWPRLP